MKRNFSTVIGAALCLTLLLVSAHAPRAEGSLIELLSEGREKFESLCGTCHELDKPLAAKLDRSQWEGVLAEMEKKGAQVNSEEKKAIIEYLTVRLTFDAKCTVCHTKERVFDRARKLTEWKRTVTEMARKQPDTISADDVGRIVAYLELVLGTPPPYMGEEGK